MFSWVSQLGEWITAAVLRFVFGFFGFFRDLLWDAIKDKLETALSACGGIENIDSLKVYWEYASQWFPMQHLLCGLGALLAVKVLVISWRMVWRFLPTLSW